MPSASAPTAALTVATFSIAVWRNVYGFESLTWIAQLKPVEVACHRSGSEESDLLGQPGTAGRLCRDVEGAAGGGNERSRVAAAGDEPADDEIDVRLGKLVGHEPAVGIRSEGGRKPRVDLVVGVDDRRRPDQRRDPVHVPGDELGPGPRSASCCWRNSSSRRLRTKTVTRRSVKATTPAKPEGQPALERLRAEPPDARRDQMAEMSIREPASPGSDDRLRRHRRVASRPAS